MPRSKSKAKGASGDMLEDALAYAHKMLVEGIASHEKAEHAGEVCLAARVNTVAYIAVLLGVEDRDLIGNAIIETKQSILSEVDRLRLEHK